MGNVIPGYIYIDIFSMGNVRHIQYRDFFWLRFTGGGDPLLNLVNRKP